MLYFTIIYWILTVLFSLSYTLLMFAPFGNDTKDSKMRGYLLVASCFLTSVVFTSLKEVIPVNTAILIWKILSALSLLLISCICLFSSQRTVHNIISFFCCVALGAIPFLINIDVLPSDNIIPKLENIYSLDLIIISSTIIVFLFSLILIKYFSKKALIKSIDELRNEVTIGNIGKEKQMSVFREPYEKILMEELHSQISKLRNTVKETTHEFRSIINETPSSSNKGELDSEAITDLLYDLINSVEYLKKKVSTISYNDPKEPNFNDFDNLDIIKELNHF